MTAEFLEFSKRAGNDLSTPRPEWGFAGLQPGDRWCVCASRWLEAHEAGSAAPVVLGATHARARGRADRGADRTRARARDCLEAYASATMTGVWSGTVVNSTCMTL